MPPACMSEPIRPSPTTTCTITPHTEFKFTEATRLVAKNTLKNNDIGFYAYSSTSSFFDNTLINNKTAGISLSFSTNQITNNTILQSAGTAILSASAYVTTIKNNIFQLIGGNVFNVDAASQTGFASDWNLFDLEGTSTFAKWAGQTVVDFNAWHFGTGLDIHGITGDPQFVDPAQRQLPAGTDLAGNRCRRSVLAVRQRTRRQWRARQSRHRRQHRRGHPERQSGRPGAGSPTVRKNWRRGSLPPSPSAPTASAASRTSYC